MKAILQGRVVLAALATAIFFSGNATGESAFGGPKRVAWLGFAGENPADSGPVRVVRERLTERGYVDGRDVMVKVFVPITSERADLVLALAEALAWKPDVIEVRTSSHARLAMEATRKVPIVFSWVGDPVAAGIVADMRRPGGNATGVSQGTVELQQKRLELAREVSPSCRTIALAYDARGGVHQAAILPAMRKAAAMLRFELREADAADFTGGLTAALRSVAGARPCAVVIAGAIIDPRYFQTLVEFQWQTGIPVIDDLDASARAGVVFSLSESARSHFRRVADITALILAGGRPGDIPVDAAAHIELLLNAASARRIGLDIPQSVRLRADRVIE